MSNKLLSRLVKIFSWGVMGVSVLIALIFFIRISGVDAPAEQHTVAASYINWAIILLGIAAVLAVIFPLIYFLFNPKNVLKVLLALGALVVVFVVAYLLADTTPIITATSSIEPNFSNPSVLAFADTGIFATYILLGIALFLLLFTGLRGVFNR